MDRPPTDTLEAARGAPVFAARGERIGDLDAIYYDFETRDPEWLGVATGFIATKRVLVPVEGARVESDGIHVAFERTLVEAAPETASDEVTEAEEDELYRHYGLEPPVRTDATTEVAAPVPAPGDAPFLVRHEEELVVDKETVEIGRVRLVKRVEVEPVSVDVDLEREVIEVLRVPVGLPVDGAEVAAQQLEIPLQAEEPVVETAVVARERVSVAKETVAETRRVEDEVRVERVDVDGESEEDAVEWARGDAV